MFRTLLTTLLVIVVLVVLMRLLEKYMVFHPTKYPEGFWHPESFGLKVEDSNFQTADGVSLHGWYLRHEKPIATLLWFHGNAGNISDRLDNIARLVTLPVNIFIFDYRGYGRSMGTPSETGFYRDASAAYDFLIKEKAAAPHALIFFGRSLGGAVAVDLATKRPCAGVVLESTFTSTREMAKRLLPYLPVSILMQTEFDSLRKIREAKAPLLFIHGRSDKTVPFEFGRRLYAAAREPKQFYEIAAADHNDTYMVGGAAYIAQLRAFVEKCVVTEP